MLFVHVASLSDKVCFPYFCIYIIVQCRLEANYAHQQELEMLPLMMQKDYKPQGWRKSQYQYQALHLV